MKTEDNLSLVKKTDTEQFAQISFIDIEESEARKKFVRIEKDLFTIGFFSVPKYRNNKKVPKQEKIVKMTNIADCGLDTKAEILTHPRYGLPTTGDLTKYLAFLKIVFERYKIGNGIQNPIQFTHYELLQKANLTCSKSSYDEVTEWLERLDNTQIIIYGETEDKKSDEKRLYKLFQEVSLSGRTTNKGEKEKFNHVWLSDWTIKNICEKPLIPIDFEAYQKLKNDVAKLLVVHLQVWLYSSQKRSFFEKEYPKFCQLLDLNEQKSKSQIIRQISPALDELKKYEYVSNWTLEKGKNELKIKIWHGTKFQRDLKKALFITKEPKDLLLQLPSNQEQNDSPSQSPEKEKMLSRLLELGIYKDLALPLIEKFSVEKLELRIAWALKELRLKEEKEPVKKPGGFLYKIINSEEDEPSFLDLSEPPTFYELHNGNLPCPNTEIDKEFEKTKWLRQEFENYCYQEASQNPIVEYKIFEKSFGVGQNIWNSLLDEIKEKFNCQIYDSWFKPIHFVGMDANGLQIAGTEVNRDWITVYYKNFIDEVFKKLNLPEYQLTWIVSEAIPQNADCSYLYRLYLVNKFQEKTSSTFEDFIEKFETELTDKFEEYYSQLTQEEEFC